MSPREGMWAMLVTLSDLADLAYNTTQFLIDLESEEVFVAVLNRRQWLGLFCSTRDFFTDTLSRQIGI